MNGCVYVSDGSQNMSNENGFRLLVLAAWISINHNENKSQPI